MPQTPIIQCRPEEYRDACLAQAWIDSLPASQRRAPRLQAIIRAIIDCYACIEYHGPKGALTISD